MTVPPQKAAYFAGTTESNKASLGLGYVATHVGARDIFIMGLSPKDGQLLCQCSKKFNFSIFGSTMTSLEPPW